MRLCEFFNLSESHSDVGALVDQVRGLSRATASFMADKTIIHFEIGGQKGWLRLKADQGVDANESRARAAARTQLGGARPKDTAEVRRVLTRGIGHRALKILLSPEAYTVIGARWGDIAYGAQV